MNLIPRNSLFDVDHFFDNSWVPFRHHSDLNQLAPRVDVKDRDDRYEISAEIPGVKKEDIQVTLNDGLLSIQAETRQENNEEQNGKLIRQERRYGRFVRSFDLGNAVHESDITANYDDGVLHIVVPKTEPTRPEAKRIEIQ